MFERAEIFIIDDEGIFLRAFTEERVYFFDGNPEELQSPLMEALGEYYENQAAETLLCQGFNTPSGSLYWESELITPFGDEDVVEVGERLYLQTDTGERVLDENAYELLSQGTIPPGWSLIER